MDRVFERACFSIEMNPGSSIGTGWGSVVTASRKESVGSVVGHVADALQNDIEFVHVHLIY